MEEGEERDSLAETGVLALCETASTQHLHGLGLFLSERQLGHWNSKADWDYKLCQLCGVRVIRVVISKPRVHYKWLSQLGDAQSQSVKNKAEEVRIEFTQISELCPSALPEKI